MPLTTVANGRTYDWSHAVGRASATGTGFNYPQTMCLGSDGDVFVEGFQWSPRLLMRSCSRCSGVEEAETRREACRAPLKPPEGLNGPPVPSLSLLNVIRRRGLGVML